jgi:hypothetical protein
MPTATWVWPVPPESVRLEAEYPLFDHWQELAVVPDQGVSMETWSVRVKT